MTVQTEVLSYSGRLTVTKCWCGIRHGIPSELYLQAERDSRMVVYCPLGHQWVKKRGLEEDLAEAKNDLEWYRRRLSEEQEGRERTERRLSATRGVVTKTRKRIAAGVCPCCKRTFVGLGRHMASQHPDYVERELP